MALMPVKHTRVITRHEWVITRDGEPLMARDLSDGMHFAHQDMVEMGISLSSDDCYHVEAGDNEITLYVDVEDEE